jgi:predicted PurR-regulated permease PerM
VTPRSKRGSEAWLSVPLVTIVIIIAALYLGKDVLVPFALALLISFLLTPPVTWLEKLKLGNAPSVVIVLVIAFSAGGGMIWMGARQLSDIISNLPQYQENIARKIEAIRNPSVPGFAKVAGSIQQLAKLLAPDTSAANRQKNLPPETKTRKRTAKQPQPVTPMPVEIVSHQTNMLDSLGGISTSLLHFLAVAGAVMILTLFILVNRGDLRNRLFRLLGQGKLALATTALDDAAKRVSRYLLSQSLVNGTFGFLLGFGLYWIGLPYAPFWGVLAALLRFVPYVGTLVAGACPLLLALAVFDGWSRPLLTLVLFVAIEGTTSSLVEPWLYGTRTGISSLAILLSAAFWTLLWGPIGLVLSTPLTVCLAVLGRHVPQLEFLQILLGDEPVLSPEARYYQRLLAMDDDEAAEIAEGYLKEKNLSELYDSVLVPALSLAERDRHENRLDDERQKFVYQSTRDLIEDLGERLPPELDAKPPVSSLSIRCVPARDEADELVGVMLAQLLQRTGYEAEAIPIGSVENMLTRLAQACPHVLFVSALPPFALTHARSVCRRVRQRCPGAKIVVGLWNSLAELEKINERLGPGCSDYVMTSLAQAESQVKVFASSMSLQKS